MNKIYLVLFLILGLTIQTAVAQENKNEWVRLFNGVDLDDWTVKITGYPLHENFENTFVVTKDSTLLVNYDGYDEFNQRFGHIFFNKEFSNYRFRMEYRFVGSQVKGGPGWATRNSGIMLHCQDPKTMELEQDFPISIEVQLLGGLSDGERTTGNVCTPGTHIVMDKKLETRHCYKSKSKTYHGDQWVQVEVLVKNNQIIRHLINGETVLSYESPQIGGGNVKYDIEKLKTMEGMMLKKGYISLQSESHPVEFRNIEILELE